MDPSPPSEPRAPRPWRWAERTWEELAALDRSRTVALLPVGAVEAHGPHLPLGTDVIIAQAMARAGAEALEGAGWGALVLPPLWYSAAPFARDFPGTVGVDGATVTALVTQIAASLEGQGFAALGVANAHLDPAHLRSLHDAVAAREEAGGIPVVFPDLTRGRHARRLTEEFQTGACHAGRFEGSIVLSETPGLVRQATAAGLPPNPASLSEAIARGDDSFAAAGGPRAYFGWPAEATAAEGVESSQIMGRILADALLEKLEG